MEPRFNPDTLKFECFCTFRTVEFASLRGYIYHCKSSRHRLWKQKYNVSDKIPVPLCSLCSDPLPDPCKHQCLFKNMSKLKENFHKKIASQKEKFHPCHSCNCLLFLSVLSNARVWKNEIYCIPCFNSKFRKIQNAQRALVKSTLLAATDNKCALCSRIIEKTDSTIFEHMNPFLKKTNPSEGLLKGDPTNQIVTNCLREGICIVHLMCAQLKTILEQESKQIQSKIQLKKWKLDQEDIQTKKAQDYELHVLPIITDFIKTYEPPNKKRKHE